MSLSGRRPAIPHEVKLHTLWHRFGSQAATDRIVGSQRPHPRDVRRNGADGCPLHDDAFAPARLKILMRTPYAVIRSTGAC
jgi:hypothetical protein